MLLRPVVPDLNIAGEIVTMIDPNADVIEDATVQALLETMDGERTVVCIKVVYVLLLLKIVKFRELKIYRRICVTTVGLVESSLMII